MISGPLGAAGTLIFGMFGKKIYDTIDNRLFLEQLTKHPDFLTVATVLLDTVAHTTTSESIALEVQKHRPLILKTLGTPELLKGGTINFSGILSDLFRSNIEDHLGAAGIPIPHRSDPLRDQPTHSSIRNPSPDVPGCEISDLILGGSLD